MSANASYQPEGWTRPISPLAPEGAHIACWNHVARTRLQALKASDLRLWLFVLQDTLGRGLKYQHYHTSQLRQGARTGGVMRCRGTGLSENTLTLAMLGLELDDLLKIKNGNGPGKWFEVNVDHCMNAEVRDDGRPVARSRYAKRPDYERFEAPPGSHIHAVKALCSRWAPDLSDSELKTLIFLINGTLGSNRDRGHYTLHQIMNGVEKMDGSGWWSCGTGLSRRATIKAIHDLEKLGVIDVETIGPGARVFRVHHELEHIPVIGREADRHGTTTDEGKPSNVIEFPANDGANFAEEGCKLCGDGVQTLRTSNKNNIQELTEPTLTTGSRRSALAIEKDTGEEIPTKGLTASRPRAEEPLTPQPPVPRAAHQPSATRQAVDALEAVWREAYEAQFQAGLIPANAPPAPWTASDRKQAQRLAKDWNRNGYDPARLPLFLAFIVRDWRTVLDQHNPPPPGKEPLSEVVPPALWRFIICGFIDEAHAQAYLAAEPRSKKP